MSNKSQKLIIEIDLISLMSKKDKKISKINRKKSNIKSGGKETKTLLKECKSRIALSKVEMLILDNAIPEDEGATNQEVRDNLDAKSLLETKMSELSVIKDFLTKTGKFDADSLKLHELEKLVTKHNYFVAKRVKLEERLSLISATEKQVKVQKKINRLSGRINTLSTKISKRTKKKDTKPVWKSS